MEKNQLFRENEELRGNYLRKKEETVEVESQNQSGSLESIRPYVPKKTDEWPRSTES